MKWLKRTALFVGLLAVIYLLGPRPKSLSLDPTLPITTTYLQTLEQEIDQGEQANPRIKPDNQARIVWADPGRKAKTEYSVVYLHGWSASQGEGDPIHREFAQRYGCNMYLSRLHGHGLEGEEGMSGIDVTAMLESAKEAVAIGQLIGEKVILMSCSTGSTLALYIASGNPDIHALINYSPNIDLYDPNSFLLTWPWGLQLAHLVTGSEYHQFDGDAGVQQYWTTRYQMKAIVRLKSLINATMQESTFRKIKQPFFMAYYYEDDDHQDEVVSVPRMLEMYDQLGTPPHLKRAVALPTTKAHGLCSRHWSKDLRAVREATYAFVEEVLGMRTVVAVEMPALMESD